MQDERRDAFSVLKKAAKKRSSDPVQTSAKKPKGAKPEPGKYEECPVCSCQIPSAFLAEHASRCGLAKQQQSGSVAAAQAPADAHTYAAALAEPEINGAAMQQTLEPAAGVHSGAEACAGAALPGDPPSAGSVQRPTARPQGSPAGSAFEHMLQRQKDLSRTHCFYLEGLVDGGFRCHWWLRGSAGAQRPPAKAVWSATSSVALSRLPGGGDGKLGLQLLTNVPPAAGGDAVTWQSPGLLSNQPPPDGCFRGSPSLLKSALQKNVRLCRAGSAVRTALHLIKDDPSELLRRLSIIMLEDAVLHPDLPLVAWLMAAAAKKYAPSLPLVERCLSAVHQVSAVRVRDTLHAEAPSPDAQPEQAAGDPFMAVDGHCAPEAEVLLKSIMLRAAFGGMAGDIEMLNGFTAVWRHRFSGQGGPPPTGQRTAAPAQEGAGASESWLEYIHALYQAGSAGHMDALVVGPVRRDDIPISAVDFHVSDLVPSLLMNDDIFQAAEDVAQLPGSGCDDAEQALKKVIWKYRSSLSEKRPLHTEKHSAQEVDTDPSERTVNDALLQLWEHIVKPAQSISHAHLRRKFG